MSFPDEDEECETRFADRGLLLRSTVTFRLIVHRTRDDKSTFPDTPRCDVLVAVEVLVVGGGCR